MMERRRLGTNGPEVAPVGLGCMSFGGIYGATDVVESHRTLARAIDLGIDHLDTADIYGQGVSEEVIGSFLKTRPHRFVIATKAAIKVSPQRSFDNSPDHLRSALEGSLRRLGVEHVDLFYIHRREAGRPIEDVMATLVRFKEEGKIGAIGLSEISPGTLRRANAVHPVAAVQNEYSLWTRLPELGLIQECERSGTALVAFSPLARGMFGARKLVPADFPPGDFRITNPRFMEPNFSHNLAAADRFRAFAAERGQSPAALAIAWVLHRSAQIVAIPGTRSALHLEDDAAAMAIRLSPEDMAVIEAVLPVGFAHGDRYSDAQAVGPERYC
ncbi:aldo/keto reductase [Aurantimonas sp. A2-1-M11]|uniref:aldo/keto reductase n=1 Tax=Aurantimonas sp. A2-1-M11 TaxID=3113712 RepID=UPI002F953A00